MQKITTFLTFKSRGKEAVDFYVSIFKNSKINSSMVMPGGNQLLHASFVLDGREFMAMDADDPTFTFTDGISLFVSLSGVDHFANAYSSCCKGIELSARVMR